MIPSNTILWRRMLDADRGAQCLIAAYGYEDLTPALGTKMAEAVYMATARLSSPSLDAEFFAHARRARRKSFLSPEYTSFMSRWYQMMRERSEIWTIIKTQSIRCPR